MSDVIRRDLERKLLDGFRTLTETNIGVARVVLGPADVARLMIGLAVTATTSTAATIASMSDPAGQAALYDTTIEEIVRRCAVRRAEALTKVAAGERG